MFFGEGKCQGTTFSGIRTDESCTNKAYYKQGSRYLCGVHSDPNKRTKLKKNPNAAKNRSEKLQNHEQTVETARLKNQKQSIPGSVQCSKIGMRTSPEDIQGFLKVFPNNKHQGRKDGFGCCSLSPMRLGPILHGQKGLPDCKLLENYHQFNKVYNAELDSDKKPKKLFYRQQLQGYRSSTPQRRKYTSISVIPGWKKKDKLKTLYSIHLDMDGKEKHYDYIGSRYFYCHFYEQLVQGNADLDTLRQMLREGTNLQIVGYDGFHVSKDLMYHYMETSRPFGHELVLYTLLTVTDPREYPWNKYYEMHSEMYPSSLKPDYLTTVGDSKAEDAALSNSEETSDTE